MAIDKHRQEGRGVHVVYHPAARLVGDHRMMSIGYGDSIVTDLERTDDMFLVSSSWSDLEATTASLNTQCAAMGLTISCKKTKTLAALPCIYPSCQQPEPILLSPDADPWSLFQLSSTLEAQCQRTAVPVLR